MKLKIKLYHAPPGICGDIAFPDGIYSTGCMGLDAQMVVEGFYRNLEKFPKDQLQINITSKEFGLRRCDKPLSKDILEEIMHLLRAQDYNVR